MKKGFIISFVFLLFLFFHVKSVSAFTLLEDDFQDGDVDGWRVILQGEYPESAQQPIDSPWEVANVGGNFRYGKTLYLPSQRSISIPIINPSELLKWKDYTFEVDMYPSSTTYDRNLLFRYKDPTHSYGLHIMPELIHLIRYKPGSPYGEDIAGYWKHFGYSSVHIKVEVKENRIKVFANSDEPLIDFLDTTEFKILDGTIGLYITTGASHPHTVFFDNILVTTQLSLQPLILLPGLGASWNHEAMILDVNKPPKDWYMTPGVKSYDGIIQTLQNAGYVLGTDLFIFNYDWRKPIGEIANDLKAYIANIVHPPPGTEIDLIGHSLGGMVARTYVQNNLIDHNVDQLLTIGSPHHGAPQVYYLWEGADLNKTFKYAWMRIGAGVLIQFKKHGFENNVETVRQIFPGLKNLLPDFPYLKKYGVPKPIEGMSQQNQWLANMNVLPLPNHLISRLTTILGRKVDTLRWIVVKPSDWLDQLIGRWEDGKPINEEFNMGDDSVLVTSGQLEGAEVIDLEGLDHGDLVESVAGQQEIVNKLGLSPTSIVPAPKISLEPALIFQLASPATIAVFGPNGWQIGEGVSNNIPDGIYSSADKLIIIPEPLEGNYETRVTGEGGGGNYRLLIGNVNPENDLWREEGGQVGNGETKTHQITYSSQPKLNKIDLLKLTKTRLSEAKTKADTCRYPARLTLKGTIQSINEQVNMVVYLVKLNQETLAEKQLKLVIKNLVNLEKNFKFMSLGCGAKTQQEILFSLRQARDYLLQALEI